MKRFAITSIIFSMLTMIQTACADNKETDTFKTKSGKEVVITPIKHASMQIQYNGLEIEDVSKLLKGSGIDVRIRNYQ